MTPYDDILGPLLFIYSISITIWITMSYLHERAKRKRQAEFRIELIQATKDTHTRQIGDLFEAESNIRGYVNKFQRETQAKLKFLDEQVEQLMRFRIEEEFKKGK